MEDLQVVEGTVPGVLELKLHKLQSDTVSRWCPDRPITVLPLGVVVGEERGLDGAFVGGEVLLAVGLYASQMDTCGLKF